MCYFVTFFTNYFVGRANYWPIFATVDQPKNIYKMSTNSTARVYVGTYNKYNNGSTAGAWIDLEDHDEESFAEAIRELHADEADPEYMYQDREGFGAEVFDESGPKKGAWEALEAWKAMDEDRREAFGIFVANGSHDLGEAAEAFEEAYQGQYNSREAFAEQLAEDVGVQVPDTWPLNCIDWERAARDLFMGDYWEEDGYVFRSI